MLRVEVSRSLQDQRIKLDGQTPPNLDQLTPWERELLKRRPIIPLDGFIPNSVVRKCLGYVKPISPHSMKMKKDGGRWKVKPIPRVDPKHMPAGWVPEDIVEENEDDFDNTRQIILDYDDTESENGSTDSSSTIVNDKNTKTKKPKRPKHKHRCDTDLDSELEDDSKYEEVTLEDTKEIAQSMVGSQMSLLKPGDNLKTTEPLSWNFIDEEDRPSTIPAPWRKMGMMMRATSNLSTTSSKGEKKSRSSSKQSAPNTPTTRYELKSKKFEFNKFDFDMRPPDRLKSGGRETSRERSKSFRLTNMVVDEDSTDIRFKEGEKSGKRRLFPAVDLEVVHQLMDEDWFPDLQGSPSFDSIMSHLMNLLDDTENQEQHEKVCDYLLAIHKQVGIPDIYLDRIVSKISNQLGHSKKNIKHDGLRTLKELGGDRPDVLATILPRLIDSQADIRSEAADILATLVGVRDKSDLLRLMEDMGISSKYDSKEDEEEALKALAMRLDIPYRTNSFNDWIGNWVDDLSSPGLHDADDLKLADIEKTWDGREKKKKFPESLHISDSNSRASNRLRELSFISDKSGGEFWTPETQASGRRQKSFHLKERHRDSISTSSQESIKFKRRNSVTKVEISGKSSAISDEYDDFPDGFDPRNPMVYQYYLKRFGKLTRPKSGKVLEGGGGIVPEEGEEEFVDQISSKVTDIMEMSSVASSQEFPETLSSQFGDGMSAHDSGIGRDMSELSSSRRELGKIIPVSSSQYSGKPVNQVRIRKYPSKQGWIPRHQLSPVKSTGALSEISPSPVMQKTIAADWQKFFETPTALERKRLDRVRKEYSKGKLKPVEKPTIRYIADGLPTLPGEAGMRLLHTIKVGDKSQHVDTEGRHRIQSIPGKLMVHTKDENSGMSKFGILQMKWTTGVPCSMTRDYDDFSSRSGTCTPTTVVSMMTARSTGSRLDGSKLPDLQRVKKGSRSKVKHIRSDDSVLPTINSSSPYSPDFEWEHPMPPPPAKDSRTNVAYIKKQHDNYCKYYSLAKRNMQRDISISKYLRNIEVFDSLYNSYIRWKEKRMWSSRYRSETCLK